MNFMDERKFSLQRETPISVALPEKVQVRAEDKGFSKNFSPRIDQPLNPTRHNRCPELPPLPS